MVPAVEFHAAIVPDRVANRNVEAAPFRRKLPVPAELKVWPVGPPATETTRPCFTPRPLYNVDTFVPWSDSQKGLVGAKDIPQGLISCESVTVASPLTLETRLVCM